MTREELIKAIEAARGRVDKEMKTLAELHALLARVRP